VLESSDNQLNDQEQEIALERLGTLHADKSSSYAELYNQDAIKLSDVGFKNDGWHYKVHPGSDINSDKIGKLKSIPLLGMGYSVSAQDATAKAGIKAYILRQPDPKKNGWPEVGQTPDGKYHIISGHTRLAAVMLSGRKTAKVRVFQYTQDGVWLKKPKSSLATST